MRKLKILIKYNNNRNKINNKGILKSKQNKKKKEIIMKK